MREFVLIKDQNPVWKDNFKTNVLKFMQGYALVLEDLHKSNSPLIRNTQYDHSIEEYESLLYTVIRMTLTPDAPPTTYYLRNRELVGYLVDKCTDLLENMYFYEDAHDYALEFTLVVRKLMQGYTNKRSKKPSLVN